MNCDRCRSLASEALDGALTGPLLTAFREHADACPPCRSFLAELRDSLALLTELPQIEVGDRFDSAVWAAIRASERRATPGWRRWIELPGGVLADVFAWRWAPAMAVGTLALALAVSLGPNSNRSDYGSVPDSAASGRLQASLPGFTQDPIEGGSGWEPMEVSVEAPMPVPVELSLQQTGSDVRLRKGNSPRRPGFTYTYPVRQVEVNGMQRVGAPVGPTIVRPVSADPRPAVIAF